MEGIGHFFLFGFLLHFIFFIGKDGGVDMWLLIQELILLVTLNCV